MMHTLNIIVSVNFTVQLNLPNLIDKFDLIFVIIFFFYMLHSKSSQIDFISELGNILHLIIYVLFLKVSTIYRNTFSTTLCKLLYSGSKVIFRQAI